MRIFTYVTTVLLAGIALQAVAGAAVAQAPPTRFYGTITINGAPAPAGTEVTAYVGDLLCGASLTAADDGFYFVDVAHDVTIPGCGVESTEVRFAVNGIGANESGYFRQGIFVNLDLSVSGEPLPLALPPEPAPEQVAEG